MVAVRPYVPDRGDIVWVSLDPTVGHEQRGRRPALVLSPKSYNKKSGLALACPITSHIKGYPFEVVVSMPREDGVVLVDDIRSMDWHERTFELIKRAEPSELFEAQQLLERLLA